MGSDKAAALRAELERNPADARIVTDLVLYLREAARYQDALQALAVFTGSASRHPGLVIQRGLLARDLNDASGALAIFEDGERIHPLDASIKLQIAVTKRALGDLAGATVKLREIVELQPSNLGAKSELITCLRRLHRPEEAAEVLQALIAQSPDHASVFIHRGFLARDRKDLAGALAAFEAGARLHPDNSGIKFNLGASRRDVGDLEGAVTVFEDLLAAQPSNKELRTELIAVLRRLRRFDDAAKHLEELAGQDTHHLSVFVLGGLLARDRDDLPAAAAMFEAGLRRYPEHVGLKMHLAVSKRALGDPEGALTVLRELIAKRPDNADVASEIITILRGLRRYPEAETELELFAKQHPEHPLISLHRGFLARDRGDAHAALSSFEEGARRHPDHAGLKLQLAISKRLSGDLGGAVATLRELVTSQPASTDPRIELAIALRALGHYDDAATVLEDLARIDPGHPAVYLQKGMLALDRNQATDAISLFEDGVRHHPGHSDMRLQLAVAKRRAGDFSGSLADLRSARAEDPNHRIDSEICGLLRDLGCHEEADALQVEADRQTSEPFLVGVPRHLLDPIKSGIIGRIQAQRQAGPVSVTKTLEDISHQLPAMNVEEDRPAAPIVIVLGMHRSGTSALARELVRGGAAIPGTPKPGSERSNPDGHFEPSEIVALHNRALITLGSSWHAVGCLPENWIDRPEMTQLQSLMRGTLRHFGATTSAQAGDEVADRSIPFVIKDPRMCRLLPLWRPLIDSFPTSFTTLVIIRSPTVVARSLARRDGMPIEHALLLWARHYDDVLQSPLASAARYLTYEDVTAAQIKELLGAIPGLRTLDDLLFQPKIEQQAPIEHPVEAAYQAYRQSGSISDLREALARLLSPLAAWSDVLARYDRYDLRVTS